MDNAPEKPGNTHEHLVGSAAAWWENLAVGGCYFVAATALAGRTAGHAVLGQRIVDEVTYRRPGWRAAMIRWGVRLPPRVIVIAAAHSPITRRSAEAVPDVQAEVDELRRRHRNDQQELIDALRDFYGNQVPMPRGCWLLPAAVLIGVAYEGIVTAGVLWPSKRQGLHDRLAHVLVLAGNAQRPAR